jgi:hypothetical protein
MVPVESPHRIHLLTALLLVGTFAAGVVTGAGVVRWFAPAAPTAVAPPPLPAARLPREIRLTPEQDEKARAIGERYRPELEALAREMRPKVRAVQDRMEGEFLALLTPEQRKQLAEIEERRRHPPRPDAPAGPGGRALPPGAPPAAGEGPPPPDGRDGPGRPPPPPEAVEACTHLDLDQLCRFTHDGREHEGSCRRGPDGQGPLSCAPDRHGQPPPPRDRRP